MAVPPYPLQYTTSPVVSYPTTDGVALAGTTGTPYANTAWTEIIATTPDVWTVVGLSVIADSLILGETEIDLGIGASGHETAVATFPHNAGPGCVLTVALPANIIPWGSRVSARVRCAVAAAAHVFTVAVCYYEGLVVGRAVLSPSPIVIEPSVASGNPSGILLTSNATPWAKSPFAWVKLTHTLIPIVIEAVHITPIGPSPAEMELELGLVPPATPETVTTIRWVSELGGIGAERAPMLAVLNPPLRVEMPPVGSFNGIYGRLSAGIASAQVRVKMMGRTSDYGLMTASTDLATQWYPPSSDSLFLSVPQGMVNSAWVAMVTATADTILVTGLCLGFNSNTGEVEFDVGIGAAGFEVVVATLRTTYAGTGGYAFDHPLLPLAEAVRVEIGVRISVRARTAFIGSTSNIQVCMGYLPYPGTSQQSTSPQLAYPTYPPATSGVSLAGAGVPWDDSAWGALTTSTEADILVTGVSFSHTVATEMVIEFGVAGSEEVITEVRCWSATPTSLYFTLPVPHFVPQGSRLSIRYRQNSSDTAARVFAATYLLSPAAPGPVVVGSSTEQWAVHRFDIRPSGGGDSGGPTT